MTLDLEDLQRKALAVQQRAKQRAEMSPAEEAAFDFGLDDVSAEWEDVSTPETILTLIAELKEARDQNDTLEKASRLKDERTVALRAKCEAMREALGALMPPQDYIDGLSDNHALLLASPGGDWTHRVMVRDLRRARKELADQGGADA